MEIWENGKLEEYIRREVLLAACLAKVPPIVSRMLGTISKLSSSARNRGLYLRRQVHEQRLFSALATPYLLLCNNNAVISSKERFMSIDLFDPRKQETVKIPEQRVSKEVHRDHRIVEGMGGS